MAGGDLAGNYPSPTLRAAESLHYVGAAGEPGFQNSWGNLAGFNHKAAFYKDREGLVHLAGTVSGGTYGGNAIFTLGAAYAPCGQSATETSPTSSSRPSRMS